MAGTESVQQMGPLVLYDGVCGLCDRTVQFTLKRNDSIRFAPLQSDLGRRLLDRCGLSGDGIDSVVFLDEQGCHTLSTAVLRMCRHLGAPWPLLSGLLLVPRPLRDGVYRFVARRRYGWFGRLEECRIPSGREKHRFLE